MKKVIILKFGWDHYAFPEAKGRAAEILELFQTARAVREEYRPASKGGSFWRVQDSNPAISIELVNADLILAPKRSDDDAIEVPALLGGTPLLKGGR